MARTELVPTRPGALGAFKLEFDWAPEPLLLAEVFDRMALEFGDLEEPLIESIVPITEGIEESFKSESDPEGEKWPLLDPDYERAKLAAGYPNEILVRTGHMKDAATSEDAFNIIPGTRAASLFYELDEPDYWIYHQTGTGDPANWGALAILKDNYRNKAITREQYQADRIIGSGAGGALPQRAFAGITPTAEFAILEIFENWVEATVDENLGYAFGPAKYGKGKKFPVIGETGGGQPIVRIPGVGSRFGRYG